MIAASERLAFTAHASLRLAQRNLRQADVSYVLTYGSRLRRTGVTFVYLRRHDIPRIHLQTRWAKLEGTVVILSQDGDLITVYRSIDKRFGYQAIRKKEKYRRGASVHKVK